MIPRPDYTDKLYTFKSSDMVKVLIGVRRCGKSSLLKLFKQNLLSQGLSDSQFIEINFEYPGFLKLQEPQEFYRYVKDRIISGQEMYLFVDEVQELKEWAKTINGI
ncbi:MAG: AAA family ATPase, partial [Coriobacteriia bacterium]|nr:AAA family ATPase [Coriobacteriia bacterium]